MIGYLWTCVRKQPIIALCFEFENELKFYNLEAWPYLHIVCISSISHVSAFNPLYTYEFFFWFDTIKLGYSISLLGVSDYNFHKNSVCVLFCQNIFFTFTNSVDPDEMQHYAAFHLGLHCLQKYLFWCFPSTDGK